MEITYDFVGLSHARGGNQGAVKAVPQQTVWGPMDVTCAPNLAKLLTSLPGTSRRILFFNENCFFAFQHQSGVLGCLSELDILSNLETGQQF